MGKLLVAFALLAPLCAFSQPKNDEYVIYANYLRVFEKERCDKCAIAIKMSTNYNNYEDVSYISDVLEDFRDYVKNKKVGMVFRPKKIMFYWIL